MYLISFDKACPCFQPHVLDGICQMLALFFQSRTGLHMAIIGPNIQPYVLECIRLHSFCVSIQVPRAFVNAPNTQHHALDRIWLRLF